MLSVLSREARWGKMCPHLPRLHVDWGTRRWPAEPGAGLTGRSRRWTRIGPKKKKTQRPPTRWSSWSLPTPERGSVSFRRDRASCNWLDSCKKKKETKPNHLYPCANNARRIPAVWERIEQDSSPAGSNPNRGRTRWLQLCGTCAALHPSSLLTASFK